MTTNATEWIRTGELIGSDKPVTAKIFADGSWANMYLDIVDYEPVAVITLNTAGAAYSTETPQDWPAIESYLPRSEWPSIIYAGKRTDAYRPHTAVDPLIAELVDEAWREADLDYADDDRIETLQQEAEEAGDTVMVELCDAALDGDDTALARCARVIVTTAIESGTRTPHVLTVA